MKIETAKNRIEEIQKEINREDQEVWEPCRQIYENERRGLPEDLHDINLVWGTIRTLIPELFFNLPRFKIKAKSALMTEDIRRKNEALLNAIIGRKDMAFSEVIKSTILAAHLNLGIVTWGCNSQFKPHPMAGKRIPGTEDATFSDTITPYDSYFIKRIRAQDFYPDLFSGELFSKLRHYTIAELMSKKEIHDIYKVPLKKLEGTISFAELDERLKERLKNEEKYGSEELRDEYIRFRVFKMYDRERQKVYTFCMEYDKYLAVEEFPKTEPVAILKFNSKLDEFWPIHEISQAVTAQREIEIASSMLSEHVKRSAKKVGIRQDLIETGVMAKIEDPYSHTGIPLPDKDAVWPIDFGTCDPSIYNHTNIQKEFFNQIMGVSASARGGAASKRTATAEIIQDKMLNVRQQDKIKIIRDFLSIVGNGIKNCIDETLTREMEVEILGPEQGPEIVTYIPKVDVYGDFDCEIDLSELAAPNEEVERNQWIGLLDIAGRSPLVFSNPTITKETLKRFGIDNKELVNAFVEIATRNMQMQAAQMGGGGSTGGGKNLPSQGGLGALMGNMIAGGVSAGG